MADYGQTNYGPTEAQKQEERVVDDRREYLNKRYLYWKAQLSATKSDPALMVIAELLVEGRSSD